MGLSVVLVQMSGLLLSTETVATAVELVTTLAARTLPDTAGAGVTLLGADGQRSLAASDAVVEQADRMQYELDEGPCLTAARTHLPVRVDDAGSDPRWPRWSAALAPSGIRAVLSVPLAVAGDTLGAIKVYSRRAGAYDDHAETVLGLFAAQAAILLANTRTVADARALSAQLTGALATRDLIGQAKGVLLARGAPGPDAAFGMLVTPSQRSNTKLVEVARALLASVTPTRSPPSTGPAGSAVPPR